MDSIGFRIKEARTKAGFTQAKLAAATHLSRSYIAGAECGRYNPSVKSLMRIASATKTDLNFLCAMTEIHDVEACSQQTSEAVIL